MTTRKKASVIVEIHENADGTVDCKFKWTTAFNLTGREMEIIASEAALKMLDKITARTTVEVDFVDDRETDLKNRAVPQLQLATPYEEMVDEWMKTNSSQRD